MVIFISVKIVRKNQIAYKNLPQIYTEFHGLKIRVTPCKSVV